MGQVYKRKLNSGMARVLIRLYRLGGASRWVNVSELFPGVTHRGGEWSRTRFWMLVEPRDRRTIDKNAKGDWSLTPWGVEFVMGQARVPRYVFIWDNNPFRFSKETTSIGESLGDRFDYASLMRGGVG